MTPTRHHPRSAERSGSPDHVHSPPLVGNDTFMAEWARNIPKVSEPGWRPSESPVKRPMEQAKNLGYDSLMMAHHRSHPPVNPYRGGRDASSGWASGRPTQMPNQVRGRSPRVVGASEHYGQKVNRRGATGAGYDPADGTAITVEGLKWNPKIIDPGSRNLRSVEPASTEGWARGKNAAESVLAGNPIPPERDMPEPRKSERPVLNAVKRTPTASPSKLAGGSSGGVGSLAAQAAAKASPASPRGSKFSLEHVDQAAADSGPTKGQLAAERRRAEAEEADRARLAALAKAAEQLMVGALLLRKGSVYEASPLVEEGHGTYVHYLGASHEDTVAAAELLAKVERTRVELADAAALLRSSLDKVKGSASEHPLILNMYETLGDMLVKKGGPDAASDVTREAVVRRLVSRVMTNVVTGHVGTSYVTDTPISDAAGKVATVGSQLAPHDKSDTSVTCWPAASPEEKIGFLWW